MKYQYPVTNKFQARAVTEPDYDEDVLEGNNPLYVNLDAIRGTDYIDRIKFNLGVDKNNNLDFTEEYVKIIFSGHRGCGKTTELKRLHNELNKPSCYFSIFISLEEQIEISKFQPEDLYVLLILELLQKLSEKNISINSSALKNLATRFFSEEAVEKELKTSFNTELGIEKEAGFNFFDFIKFKGIFKSVFAGENTTSKKIREEIKKNNIQLIREFNALLVDVRNVIINENLGEDILFIIDGSEKVRIEIYEKMFIHDGHLLKEIAANMILSVRIDAFYDIEKSPVKFTNQYVVPMIQLNKEGATHLFEKIITNRLDEKTFFESGVLLKIIEFSGGCARQLLHIVNASLMKSLGEKINLSHVYNAIKELSEKIIETLDNEHQEILKVKKFNPAEEKVRQMLQQLVLLKYNGPDSIMINPLLQNWLAKEK